jgi:hypothetical protein
LYSKKAKPTCIDAHRKPEDVFRVNQKPSSICQLLEQMENVAEKLIAEKVKNFFYQTTTVILSRNRL